MRKEGCPEANDVLKIVFPAWDDETIDKFLQLQSYYVIVEGQEHGPNESRYFSGFFVYRYKFLS